MKKIGLISFLFLFVLVITSPAQTKKKILRKTSDKPKTTVMRPDNNTIYKDSEGNIISQTEFRDAWFAEIETSLSGKLPFEQIIENGKVIEARLNKNSREGQFVAPFAVKTLDGKLINSNDLLGKVVVLNFWFVACKGCIVEMPKLNEFVEKYKNKEVVFLAITYDKANLVNKFLARTEFNYQIIPNEQKLLDSFNFVGYPRNIIIGKDGKIAYWRAAIMAWEKFEKVIESELGE